MDPIPPSISPYSSGPVAVPPIVPGPWPIEPPVVRVFHSPVMPPAVVPPVRFVSVVAGDALRGLIVVGIASSDSIPWLVDGPVRRRFPWLAVVPGRRPSCHYPPYVGQPVSMDLVDHAIPWPSFVVTMRYHHLDSNHYCCCHYCTDYRYHRRRHRRVIFVPVAGIMVVVVVEVVAVGAAAAALVVVVVVVGGGDDDAVVVVVDGGIGDAAAD